MITLRLTNTCHGNAQFIKRRISIISLWQMNNTRQNPNHLIVTLIRSERADFEDEIPIITSNIRRFLEEVRCIISVEIFATSLHDVLSSFYCISCDQIVVYIMLKGSTSRWAPKASITPKDMLLPSVSARSLIFDPLHWWTTYHI